MERRLTPDELSEADDATLTDWQRAWRAYFEARPDVIASWGYSNGRWPKPVAELSDADFHMIVAGNPMPSYDERDVIVEAERVASVDNACGTDGWFHDFRRTYVVLSALRPV